MSRTRNIRVMNENEIIFNNSINNNDGIEYCNVKFEYQSTLTDWKSSLALLLYIYQAELSASNRMIHTFSLLTIITTAISTILSIVAASLPSELNRYIFIGLNISIAVMATIATVIASISKIQGWKETADTYLSYTFDINRLLSNINIELSLADQLTSAKEFIDTYKEQYETVLTNRPVIDSKHYRKYEKEYMEYYV